MTILVACCPVVTAYACALIRAGQLPRPFPARCLAVTGSASEQARLAHLVGTCEALVTPEKEVAWPYHAHAHRTYQGMAALHHKRLYAEGVRGAYCWSDLDAAATAAATVLAETLPSAEALDLLETLVSL